MLKRLFLLLNILLFCAGLCCAANLTDEQRVVNAVILNKPCVVNIDTYEGSASGIGSGVILSEGGYIMTNAHVIKRANNIVVTLSNGEKYKASIVKTSPERDLAILKISPTKRLTVPRFGNSDNLKLGQTVIAIGNPIHFNWTVTVGVVSALNREIQFMNIRYQNLIQTDAAINPGNSGGPLINSNGEVIGINTIVYSGTNYAPAQGLSFAIPINDALDVARGLIGAATPAKSTPWLGIKGIDLTPEIADRYNFSAKKGILVTSILTDSPASRAGLKAGDILTYINGKFIENRETLKKILNALPPNATAQLTFWRQNKQSKTNITIQMVSE